VCLNAEPWHVIDKSLYGLPGIAFGRALTALLAAAITRPVRVDEPHVVIGWLQSASGRRSLVGSAIVNKHQEVCAIAEALWVERSLSQAPRA
jgi:hypothetical protein